MSKGGNRGRKKEGFPSQQLRLFRLSLPSECQECEGEGTNQKLEPYLALAALTAELTASQLNSLCQNQSWTCAIKVVVVLFLPRIYKFCFLCLFLFFLSATNVENELNCAMLLFWGLGR